MNVLNEILHIIEIAIVIVTYIHAYNNILMEKFKILPTTPITHKIRMRNACIEFHDELLYSSCDLKIKLNNICTKTTK